MGICCSFIFLISFLLRIQSEALKTLGPIGFDPKLYVDLPITWPLPFFAAAFDRLPQVNGSILEPDLRAFLAEYSGEAGSDLVLVEPPDFTSNPEEFLPKVEHPAVRAWALEVHALWRNLSHRVSDAVTADPYSHTLLSLSGQVVVPRSRYREVYYWDS